MDQGTGSVIVRAIFPNPDHVLLPGDATKETHETERGALKTVSLGVGYGMQEQSLAVRLAKT